MSEDLAATLAARADRTDTVLLGRATYEVFAGEWPYRSGAMADFLNTTPKLVVSTSLDDPSWHNTSLIDGNALITDELARLRCAAGREVLVLGSATLVQSLLRRGMIDELVLLIHPVIKGHGRRLFDELRGRVPMDHVESVTFDKGLVSLSCTMNSRSARSPNQRTPGAGIANGGHDHDYDPRPRDPRAGSSIQ
jgi:dihydrofolate reductase